MSKISVTLIKSVIGCPANQRACVRSLGLRKLHQTRVFEDHPAVVGNIKKVSHLLKVLPYEGDNK